MKVLTERHVAVLAFVEAYTQQHGCSPTVREVVEHFATPSCLTRERKRYIARNRRIATKSLRLRKP